ncbi:ferredoxin reductase family protein [Microbacterium esteraromaticum]|uniref:ferredoxin reductase family protein n=1 Tax=Microbacterium esteraromaticum TaxID=57043 RepID=UPI0019D3DCB9|nr:ferric reductase-like transmembrane domain-containing protein [Microbacterium esteraromaticum]MBN7794266.1 ferric reductase-like transmembrane domain-containing protein [Microbacterium esteraromaticum]
MVASPHAPAFTAPRAQNALRRLEAWRLGAVIVVWSTSLFVVALWVGGGGVDALLGGGAETLNALGRLTGLVASNLLLLLVLLMARIPLFERGFGKDGMTRMHRLTGFWSFSLMLAHLALQTLGYAVAAGVDPIAQFVEFVVDYPGMLLALAGTVLVVLVTLTSIRRARRRLRYESWHLLHLYAYLGVGLALPHQLWTGADFTASTAATWYWWGLWIAAAIAVVVYRVIVPLARSSRLRLRVSEVSPDGSDGVTVRMRGGAVHRLGARPGQFFVWRFLDGPGWTRGHPFSLSAAPTRDELTISARVVGDGTERLTALTPGTRVLIEGPYGAMTGERRSGRRMLLIGAGAGVAPLVALLEGEQYGPGEATIITRDSTPAAALRTEALAVLERERGVRHVALFGARARSGAAWLPESHAGWNGADALRFLAADPLDYDVYVCGPPPWMAAVLRDVRAAGFPSSQVHHESFTV